MKHIIWFKRDLRIHDHRPLLEACASNNALALYILEPKLWQQPDMSPRQYHFLLECLEDLDNALASIGLPLLIQVGDSVTILHKLKQIYQQFTLYSHQETWNDWTYQRDKLVLQWCKVNQIKWHEYQNNGVIRRLKSRYGWARLWHEYMSQKITQIIKYNGVVADAIINDVIPSVTELFNAQDNCPKRQKGGRGRALRILHSFLYQRGQYYTYRMSSPVTAYQQCSRLSPYIAFGVISIREIYQSVLKRQQSFDINGNKAMQSWARSIQSYLKRLHWHCHFIQKLESQPDIEFTNLHPATRHIRPTTANPILLAAWANGQTGYPLIDACMRALKHTGWINFRMRALLLSFASHHLWLPWQDTALVLARLFTDYEPGIHYSQCQMQSCSSGINSIRIYNPIKQSYEQDPNGVFIRRWVPELAHLDKEKIHTPWLYSVSEEIYPAPIVDEEAARKQAAKILYDLRKGVDFKSQAKKIYEKHGSRKRQNNSAKKKKKEHKPVQQVFFFID